MRTFLALCLLVLAAPAARALEVSLEENRAQHGSMGYVDMQRVFRLFPETQRAKQNFSEVMRQAEEQVNLKRAELIALRTDIAKLNGERDLLLKTPIPAAEPPPDAARSTAPALGQLPEPTTAPLVINIPGLTNAPIVVQPPPASSVSAPPPPPPAPTAAELSARRDSRLKELDQALGEKIADLAKKEAGFKEYQAVTEKNLLELEGRRSEMLLGKIYAAVREVARENSVSVVVDKTQILFGQNSVDLTDKVLKKLSGEEKPKTTEPKP